MLYEFRCPGHGTFTLKQGILSDHVARCPECDCPAQRIYSPFRWGQGNPVFRPDGSYREDKDYAVLKG
ncbi:hypothetical protein LCGC14_0369490 [marine sediment metagenome]|uniref:Putative regulatory protein FmdB zinc ribbon domain-containing protein n=1 Tax=marine sediment metagenome TaxID=412755 RepID=A0A0F9T5E8_9ZZZZ